MADLRVVKKSEEVQALKTANEHTRSGFEAILNGIEPGLKEYEMSALFEYKVRCSGSKGLGFPTIAASGGNAVILHYVENDDTMKSGDLLLLDFGALHDNYSADISRTIPVNGKYSERQKYFTILFLKRKKRLLRLLNQAFLMQNSMKFARRSY